MIFFEFSRSFCDSCCTTANRDFFSDVFRKFQLNCSERKLKLSFFAILHQVGGCWMT